MIMTFLSSVARPKSVIGKFCEIKLLMNDKLISANSNLAMNRLQCVSVKNSREYFRKRQFELCTVLVWDWTVLTINFTIRFGRRLQF